MIVYCSKGATCSLGLCESPGPVGDGVGDIAAPGDGRRRLDSGGEVRGSGGRERGRSGGRFGKKALLVVHARDGGNFRTEKGSEDWERSVSQGGAALEVIRRCSGGWLRSGACSAP